MIKQRALVINKFKEHKTGQKFRKYVWNEDVVKELEKYVAQRKKQNKKYLFWDNNDTEFTFENYDEIVKSEVLKETQLYKKIYFEKCGYTKNDFGKVVRSSYAVRHFGVQRWLQLTNYNYGLIAKMGWKDINTLILWYGERTSEYFQMELDEVMWSAV